MKIILATYANAGVRAIDLVVGSWRCRPQDLLVLTHDDDRNQCLLAYADHHGIEVLTEPCRSSLVAEAVRGFGADLFLSLLYRDYVPVEILEMPRFRPINLHCSLLPKHRGTFAGAWAIIEDDDWSGFTYHYMNETFDDGNIVLQKREPIASYDTAYSLYHRLVDKGMCHLDEAIERVLIGDEGRAQDADAATYHRRVLPFDGVIQPSWPADRVQRFIRAMYFPPHDPARFLHNGRWHFVETFDDYLEIRGEDP